MMDATLEDKLREITSSLSFFLPEIVLTVAILLIVIFGLFRKAENEVFCRILTVFVLLAAAAFDINQWLFLMPHPQPLFQNMLLLDHAAVFWKLIFEVAALLTVMMGFKVEGMANKNSEYYALILAVTLGAHLLAMSNNLLMIFIGIELISISSYILTTFRFNSSATEAGMKYLLFGATASGVMIYGMSWLYAITGTLSFTTVDFSELLMNGGMIPLVIAGIFVLGGIFFKISVAPMHVWAPDVYSAAPTPVVAFFSVVPKLAGFAILIKWIMVINLFGQSPVNWSVVLAIASLVTITIGNFSALWQQNVKRMLAYSSIAHSGFLLVALVAFTPFAMKSLLFYAATFLVMNMATFMLVNRIENNYGLTTMKAYSGFIKVSALTTVLMVILMIALAGLPPTGGFTAKLLIFSALWESYAASGNDWMLYLMIFGLVNTVISLFYYLKIPFYMIFRSSDSVIRKNENKYSIENFLGIAMVLGLLFIFFNPDALMRIINSVNFAF